MRRLLLIMIPLALVLAACSPRQPEPKAPLAAPTQPAPANQPTLPAVTPNPPDAGLLRVDEQGMVVIEVTPANLEDPADTLEFDVAMTTHSVDLSMDLATLSTLTTDTGLTVQPLRWDGPSGGHHVSGKLIFPSAVDGKSILDGAGKLTLTIVNVDAPSRLFEWELN